MQTWAGPLQPLHEFTHFPGEHSFGGPGREGTFLVQLPEGRDEKDDVRTTEESAESEESSTTSPPSSLETCES